jgi:hypothetical protein
LLEEYKRFLLELTDFAAAKGAAVLALQDSGRVQCEHCPLKEKGGVAQKKGRSCRSCVVSQERDWKQDGLGNNGLLMKQYDALLVDLATNKRPNELYTFNYDELFCVDGSCHAVIPGTDVLAFSDSYHITIAASQYTGPFLCEKLAANHLLGLG